MAPVSGELVGTIQCVFYIAPFHEHPEGLHYLLAERCEFSQAGWTADEPVRDKYQRCRVLLFSSLSVYFVLEVLPFVIPFCLGPSV